MSNRVRFIRCSYIVGWEPKDNGLGLMYSDGSRELIPMSSKEAEENSQFLVDELFEDRDIIGIAWDDGRGRGSKSLEAQSLKTTPPVQKTRPAIFQNFGTLKMALEGLEMHILIFK